MKKIALILSLSLFLSSCSLVDRLGFDTYDYMGEEIKAVHELDGKVAKSLAEVLNYIIGDTAELATFSRMSDAIESYRDIVLSHMIQSEYAKYSGNPELIEKAIELYPEYSITQIVPASDFESVMYKYFGGDFKITHKNGVRFTYLSKVNGYISQSMPEIGIYKANIISVFETDRTFRVNFTVESETKSSEPYFALIIKREDGTFYIKKLLISADVLISG